MKHFRGFWRHSVFFLGGGDRPNPWIFMFTTKVNKHIKSVMHFEKKTGRISGASLINYILMHHLQLIIPIFTGEWVYSKLNVVHQPKLEREKKNMGGEKRRKGEKWDKENRTKKETRTKEEKKKLEWKKKKWGQPRGGSIIFTFLRRMCMH